MTRVHKGVRNLRIPLGLALVALALSACAGIDAPPPGNYAVVPLDGQAITPGVFSFEANGDAYTLRLWQLFPTATMVKPSQVPPSATPSPTNTATPTLTPTPTPTNTPNLPEWPTVTPTAETTDLPPITPTPKTCSVVVNPSTAIRLRSAPSTSSTQVGTLYAPNSATIDRFENKTDYLWAFSSATNAYLALGQWATVNGVKTFSWWITFSNNDFCTGLLGWPGGLVPPGEVAREVQAGLHVLVGANAAPIMATLGAWDLIKCLSSSWDICAQAKAAKPSITTVYRTLTLGDNPPNLDSPDSWYYLQSLSWRGINADYYEYMNEFVGDYDKLATFSIRMMELAAADGRCLLLFSFAPGNPGNAAWKQLQPALDYALTHPCRPGKYHGIALHQPGYAPAGLLKDPWVNNPYISGAHRLAFRDLFQGKYTHGNPRLEVIITEIGWDTGRKDDPNLATCEQLALAIPVTNAAYKDDGIVTGWALWSVGGGGTVWVDRTACLPLVAQVVK